jgi:hypothetical protein
VADSVALRSRRHRMHVDGDHSLCRHGPLVGVRSEPGRLVRALLEEFPSSDPVSRELALRLAELAAGSGAAAVAACRALGELVAHQRMEFLVK